MAEKHDKKKKPTSTFTSNYLRDLPINQEPYKPVHGIYLQKPNASELSDYEDMIAQQAANTNFGFAPNRYIAPGAKLNPYTNALNASGFVLKNTPTEVWVDTKHPRPKNLQKFSNTSGIGWLAQDMLKQDQNKGAVGLLAHEMAHSKQYQNPAYITMTPQEYAAYEALAARYNRYTQLKDIPEGYVNPLSGSGTDPYELGAYIAGYEAGHPTATTKEGIAALVPIENTALGKVLLAPKGFVETFKAMFGLDGMKNPMELEVMHRLMGQETPTTEKKR